MPLLPRPTLILQQDPLDDPGERVELRTRRRPASPVPGRYRKRQHLRNRPRIDAKTPRCFPPAHTFNLNRITNLSIELHALHPPAPAAVRQRLSAAGFLLRRNRTARPLHKGSFLRRLQQCRCYAATMEPMSRISTPRPFRGLSDQLNAGRLRSLPSLDYVAGSARAFGKAGDPRAVQR